MAAVCRTIVAGLGAPSGSRVRELLDDTSARGYVTVSSTTALAVDKVIVVPP